MNTNIGPDTQQVPRMQPQMEPMAPPNGNPKPEKQQGIIDAVQSLGQTNVPQLAPNVYCLTVIGQVEGHLVMPDQNKTTKYEHVIPQIVAAEQNANIEGMVVILNTVGGDVEAGLAIAEMIASMTKPSVSLVLGGGHSIGVPIAVSADVSFIAETATMTIHPVRLTGLVVGVPQTFEYMEKMQERVIRFVERHSRITQEQFRELMFRTGELARDIGTNLIGADAVKHGLIDQVGGLGHALAELNRRIGMNKNAQPTPPNMSAPAANPGMMGANTSNPAKPMNGLQGPRTP